MSSRVRTWLDTYKPAARQRTHLMLAALIWTLVGCMLCTLGLYFLHPAGTPWSLLLLLAAAGVGVFKALVILDRSANRIIGRIQSRGDGKCVGGFFGVRMWGVALGFMTLGQILRRTGVPRDKLGLLYIAVGTGLLIAARLPWRAWWADGHGVGPS